MATKKKRTKLNDETSKRNIYKDFTLDEYDQLTMEQQGVGAGGERGKIIAELERRAGQLREFSRMSDFVDGRDVFAQQARGMEMALRFIRNLREYEDNVGCPECEAF